MDVYTQLPFLGVCGAGFVGDAVLRAGGGCFGLAIQNYCAVHAGSPCFVLLAGTELGCGVPVNMKGNVNELLQLIF